MNQRDVQPQTDKSTRPNVRQSVWRSMLFTAKAIEIRLRFIALLVGIGLVIGYWDVIANHWDKWTRPVKHETALSSDSEFYCPMHPSVVRAEADPSGAVPKCPICGMPLSTRKRGELPSLPEGVLSRVQLSPYRIELAGIRTSDVERRPLTINVNTVGYVAIDERKQSRIVVRASGYVEKLYVNESFSQVEAGEPLVEIYSPELYSAAQELIIANNGLGTSLIDTSREKLRLLGVADTEIEEILKTGKASSRLVIRSPHHGHVFEKRIVEGDSVQAGQTLFEVVDLRTVWIESEVYEKDAASLRTGQAAVARLDAYPGRTFEGKVSLVHPHVEPATRTVRVRFELENREHLLRPGMFANVSLSSPIQEIEPFKSQLAAQQIGAVPVTSFASAENTIDTGNYDSLLSRQKNCPVTGAKLGSMGRPVLASALGQPILLCCSGCRPKLDARPEYFADRLTTVTADSVLVVPESAVVDTGTEKIVYVEREPGVFEGALVTLGHPSDGYYPVIAGLMPGDRVASAGAFLVDAETRLNPAAASTYFGASGKSASLPQPSEVMTTPTNTSEEKERAESLAKLSPTDRAAALRQSVCPITDFPLGSMGTPHKHMVEGAAIFLCCDACVETVEEDPMQALKKAQQRSTNR